MPRTLKHSINYDFLYQEYVIKRRSFDEIAEQLNLYPNAVRRAAKRMNIPSRDRSESQKLALETGRHKHPTKGTKRTAKTKLKISQGIVDAWDNKTDDEKRAIRDKCKENWDNLTEEQKSENRKKAAQSVRKASTHGSKLELFILEKLRSNDYNPKFHEKEIVANTGLEVDIYLPEQGVVIEIDGPSHYEPIWGERNLRRNQLADKKKNGIALMNGLVMIRIKGAGHNLTLNYKTKLWDLLSSTLEKIKQSFPVEGERLIYLEA